MSRLYFIGGIYGAGKSTLCQILSPMLPGKHLKASDLIRYAPNPNDKTGKATAEVSTNQERLLSALAVLRVSSDTIILDGHFCLLDQTHTVVRLPSDVFSRMQPSALLLVESTIADVFDRIKRRDTRHLDPDLIQKLADTEREHALVVSQALGVPIMSVDASTDPERVVAFLRTSPQVG